MTRTCMESEPASNGTNRRAFWLWLIGCYFCLMVPVVAVLDVVSYQRTGSHWPLQAWILTFYLFALPALLWLTYVGMWYLGALVYFLFWKYAEMLQWLTGMPFGRWVGQRLARDQFLRHAPQSGPYGWLYGKVVERYPHEAVTV